MSIHEPMPAWPRGRKFRPGAQITRVEEVVKAMAMRQWIYYRGVPKHPSIVYNMSLCTVVGLCGAGVLYLAELNNPKEVVPI